MTDLLGSSEAEESSGTKDNFVGKIVDSAVDTDTGWDEWESDIDKLYEVEVLDKDWDNVFEYSINVSSSFQSKWMFLVGHLENIFGENLGDMGIETAEDLTNFLEGRVFEFREYDFTEEEEFTWEQSPAEKSMIIADMFEGSENPPNEMIVPVREVDDNEIKKLGVEEDAGSVEEVSFE